ncbi:uncharacterized protein [Prorops nasuta]|uniref:uncharacterized protein isoform X2 n=1 Tax=Prorops nasuta TaxID=863751 RepID=UPI0034CDEB36
MGKTPKKAAPGGDERNLYDRRLKSTTAASISETSLAESQRETENSNRANVSGIQKRAYGNAGTAKNLKLGNLPKRLSKRPGNTNKKLISTAKGLQEYYTDMKPESVETENTISISLPKTDAVNDCTEDKEIIQNKQETIGQGKEEDILDKHGINLEDVHNESGKVTTDKIVLSNSSVPVENSNLEHKNGNIDLHENGRVENDQEEEADMNISLALEENSSKSNEQLSNNDTSESKQKGESKDQESENVELRCQSDNTAEDDIQSCSVDIVESTTCELTENSDPLTQTEDESNQLKFNKEADNNESFICYNSSVMLRDVQIKLSDCLKDNSKLFDESNADLNTPSQLTKDASFGKSIRNISCRRSLNRMRHVTMRENRISPNSSLFVNTSGMSLPDELGESKILHYRSGLNDSLSSNGSSLDKKRKLKLDDSVSAKKRKTDTESGLLNASISYLKSFRMPIQVPAPSFGIYKLSPSRLYNTNKPSEESNTEVITENPPEGRKWCIIM